MHRRDLRLCLSVGVAAVKRFIFFFLLSSSFPSFASTLITWTFPGYNGGPGIYSTPYLACRQGTQFPSRYITKSGSADPYDGGDDANCNTGGGQYLGTVYKGTQSCPFGDNGTQCNASCDAPNVMSNGQCITPPTCDASKGETLVDGSCVVTNQCASKFGQDQTFKLTGNTNDPNSPVKQPPPGGLVAMPDISVGGCAASPRQSQCLFHGDGSYTCSGTARLNGEQGNTNPALDEPYVEKEPELTSDASQECSQWVEDAEGRRTRTCQTSATSSQTGKNTCERGAYDQYCFQGDPSPTPESDTATRTDNIKETTNADGSKTTETTSTTTKTYCQAGSCNTTNTTNKTTVVTGSDGTVKSETSECSGSGCDEPESPEEEKPKMPGPFKPGEKGDYLPQIGDGDEAPTYSESLDNFTDRVSNAPIVRGLTSISVPTGGSCSMGSAQLFGGSVSFNDFCTMAPQVLAGLRYLFLAIWAWAAIRLFFTA